MPKALYRKYRPRQLSEVIGQPQVTDVLAKSIKQGKISHAYLFIGPRGTGKTSVARIFAHEINGFKYELEDNYVDIIEIDGASNRGIDDIRELREKALVAPTTGKYKVYIIDEVHMLTKEAFNALLKTLEEPPSHVIFIMATTDAHKVPVTITSRAQTYTFKLADEKTILDFLKSVAKNEKINIDNDALLVIAKRGGGSFRDSLSLLDQISTLGDKITKDLVISAMGLPSDEKIAELLTIYSSADVVKITTLLKDLLASGTKPETLVEELISQIVLDPKPELVPLLAKLSDIKAPFIEAKLLVALAGAFSEPTKSAQNELLSRVATNGELRRSSPRNDGRERGGDEKARLSVDSERSGLQKAHSNTLSEQVDRTPATPITSFSWQEFLQQIKDLNEAIYSQLLKSEHQINGAVLNIYPKLKIGHTILESPNNFKLIETTAPELKITILDISEYQGPKSDQLLHQISDIMGGEVQEDGGENPF